MNSLDITSLYTDIPIKKCPDLLTTHLRKIKFNSPRSINTLVNICKHITNMTYFKFNNNFYKQKYGLPMGNPLSRVLACQFLEFLDSSPFKYRLPSNTTYFIEYTFFSLKIINSKNIDKNILEISAQKLINRKIFRLQNK